MYPNLQHQKARLDARRPAPHWKFAALGCCIAASTSVALADKCGGGHCSCPGSSTSDALDTTAAWDQWVALSGTQLLPDTTQPTLGTDSSGLEGEVLRNKTFSFTTESGDATGTVTQSVTNKNEGSCMMSYKISNAATSTVCIDALQIFGFTHPKFGLVGDFRNDLIPNGIGSTQVSRSPKPGTRIRFDVLVCPGQVSRKLFLDTSVDAASNTGTLRVRAADGTLSEAITTYVPTQP
jgi:hypothetical protein